MCTHMSEGFDSFLPLPLWYTSHIWPQRAMIADALAAILMLTLGLR